MNEAKTQSASETGSCPEIEDRVLQALALYICPGVGSISYRRLVEGFGDPAAVFKAAAENPRSVEELSVAQPKTIEALRKGPNLEAVIELIKKAGSIGARPVLAGAPEYPPLLMDLRDRPPVLWVRGSMEICDRRAVAIVGTRAPRDYGLRMARRLAHDLALAGITIVSGGARGIDSEAHAAALEAGGRTIAVLGCGIDVVYPPENADLYEGIAAGGAIVSDFPPGTQPEPSNFPIRNRIIAGLSWATCVVEAGKGSGALITAKHALEQGRDVFAVPHYADQARGQGCNQLIKEGAGLVEGAADILESLRFSPARHRCSAGPGSDPREPVELTEDEMRIASCLDAEPRHIDELAQSCGLPSSEVLVRLCELEIKGVAKALPGHLYVSTLEDRWHRG